MNWTLTRGPVDANSECITLVQAKLHLKVDTDADDSLIAPHITTARQDCEDFTNRWLVPGPGTLRLDRFPVYDAIVIPVGIANLVINSVSYIDSDGQPQTWANTEYTVYQRQNACPEIAPVYGSRYPVTRPERDAVTITFTVGTAPVDAKLVSGMLLLMGFLYENREPNALSRRSIDSLWTPYHVFHEGS